MKYLAPNKFTVNDQNGEEPFFTSNETVITGRCDICGNGTDATVTVENAFRQRKLKLSHQSRPGHPHAQK